MKAIRDVADIAFGVWAANTSLSFREVKIPDPISAVDIQVHFRTGYHGDSAVFDGEGRKSRSIIYLQYYVVTTRHFLHEVILDIFAACTSLY